MFSYSLLKPKRPQMTRHGNATRMLPLFYVLNGYRDIDIIIGSYLRKMEKLDVNE